MTTDVINVNIGVYARHRFTRRAKFIQNDASKVEEILKPGDLNVNAQPSEVIFNVSGKYTVPSWAYGHATAI